MQFGGMPPGGRFGGLQLATVVSNSAGNAGTLTVQLLRAGQSENILNGVKLLAAFAGENYGSYLLPEVGEQVVVGFLDGCFDRPVVLGSLYAAGDRFVSEGFHPANLIKRFRTKGGTMVEFLDGEGGEKITVKTPRSLSFVMEEAGNRITLEACEPPPKKDSQRQPNCARIELDGTGGTITVSASASICLQAGEKTTVFLGAESIELAGGTASLSAETAAELKSGGDFRLEAKQSEWKSEQIRLKASGILQAKGAAVKIN